MANSYRELCDTFNQSAKDLPRGGKTAEVLITRYQLLIRHKAETEEEKAQLVETLYTCGMEMLKQFTGEKSSTWLPQVMPENVKAVFGALCEPESLQHAPEKAAQELTDVAFELLTRCESVTRNDIYDDGRREAYKQAMVTFARTALQTADAFRTAIEERTIDIKTSKAITPAKRFVLKPTDPPAG